MSDKIRIDLRDVYLLRKYRWHRRKGTHPYVRARVGKAASVGLHRLIMKAPNGVEVDHIDGNPLNNSRNNLRLCTHQQNSSSRRRKPGKSGFRGVYTHRGGYHAMLVVDGCQIYLGSFKTAAEAARAYNDTAREWSGDFAQLNKGV